jgi:tRNA (cytidine32/uridine32-2'-O)-methyltransferase
MLLLNPLEFKMLERVTIVLVEPSHPGNIGAVARAMKTMGLEKLVLVSPKKYPCAEATERAASADDVLTNARVVDTLPQALEDIHWAIATSARNRYLDWPLLSPSELAQEMTQDFAGSNVAIVFGRENSGLNNEELGHCHRHVAIPSNPEYSSLNLAMAVQVIGYELRVHYLQQQGQPLKPKQKSKIPATTLEMEGFYSHLEETLISTAFLDPVKPKLLMTRLRRMYSRTMPDSSELNILRGMLKSINVSLQKTPNVGADAALSSSKKVVKRDKK